MSSGLNTEALLHCHPDTPCPVVVSIAAAITWEQRSSLRIVYTLKGAVDRLRIPPYGAIRRGDALWRHTCFEAFIGAKNDAEYYEFNFSPSGEWAVYGFRDYRDGAAYVGDGVEPKISVQRSEDSFELSGAIRLEDLPGIHADVGLCVGLSAIVEDLDASFFYWALKHPPGKPDFHHPANFALEIDRGWSMARASTIVVTDELRHRSPS
jgi:hypothetical protein